MVKKFLSVIICLSVFFQFTYISDAKTLKTDNSILQKEEVVNNTKKLLGLNQTYTLDGADFMTVEKYNKSVWALEFEDENKDKDIRVEVDAVTGDLISYDLWNRGDNSVVTYTKEETKKTALDFLKVVCPDKVDNLIEVNNDDNAYIYDKLSLSYDNSSTYKFVFLRSFEEELFMQNYIVVEVSAIDNKVQSYNMTWNDAEYTNTKKYLNDNIAKMQFEKSDCIKLKYVVEDVEDNDKVNIKPVYYYDQQKSGILDIENNKFLDNEDIYSENDYYIAYNADKSEGVAASNYVTIPQEGVISKEEATDLGKFIAKKLKIYNLNLEDSYYYGNENDKIWVLYFTNDDNINLSIKLNAENKKIYSLDFDTFSERNNIKNNADNDIKDKDKILLDINNLVDSIFKDVNEDELNFEINKDKQGDIEVKSYRYFDQIPFENHYINVKLNAENNNIKHVSFNWFYNMNVEKVNDIMPIDKVQDKFFSSVGFEKYLVQLIDKVNSDNYKVLPLKELRLGYVLRPFNFRYIDCQTGQFLDCSLKPYEEKSYRSDSFSDIKDSAYEKAINFMNKMEFIREYEEEFKPTKLLSKQDAIKWLVCVLDRHSEYCPRINRKNINVDDINFKDIDTDNPYYYYFKRAVELGIIENEKNVNPTIALKKTDCIKYILNGLGYKDLAQEPIFKIKNQDKYNEDLIGYVAIASHYELFNNQKLQTTISRGLYIQTLYDLIINLEQK